MQENLKVSAIVLAAGSASRMGSQKQLLTLGDQTLIEHTLANLRAAAGLGEIVVVLGAAAERIRPLAAAIPGVTLAMNEAFQEGMAGSLQCGLRALAEDTAATLVVLADQPLVKPETVNQLIEDYRQHKPQILIPTYLGFRGNPVLLDRSVFPEIGALGGDTGCRAIFGDHLENIRKLEVADAGVLLDADRPEDLAVLRGVYATGRFELPLVERWEDAANELEIVVVGRETVPTAVVKTARLMGYGVTVVDPLFTREQMPEASGVLRALDFSKLPEAARRFCVVASMGRFDEEAIEQALAAGFGYVALVANQKRAKEVLAGLGVRGLTAEKLKGVRTKPGLAISAQTPQEIALSIVGEIVKEFRGAGSG